MVKTICVHPKSCFQNCEFPETGLYGSSFLIGFHTSICLFSKQPLFSSTFSGKFPKLIFNLNNFKNSSRKLILYGKEPDENSVKSILLNREFPVKRSLYFYLSTTSILISRCRVAISQETEHICSE